MKKGNNKIKEKLKKLFGIEEVTEQQGIKATRHGMFNNMGYVMKTAWQMNRKFIVLLIVSSITSALYTLFGVYLPKIILGIIIG